MWETVDVQNWVECSVVLWYGFYIVQGCIIKFLWVLGMDMGKGWRHLQASEVFGSERSVLGYSVTRVRT